MTSASFAPATEQALATCKSGQPAMPPSISLMTFIKSRVPRRKMAALEESGGRPRIVKMMPWEPRMEWMARIEFIEDHIDKYGYDRALSLSMVWANVKFLHCRYPPETEELVQAYPAPTAPRKRYPKNGIYYLDGSGDEEREDEDGSNTDVTILTEAIGKYIGESRQRESTRLSRDSHVSDAVKHVFKRLDAGWLQQYLESGSGTHPVSVVHGICAKHQLRVEFAMKEVTAQEGLPLTQAYLLIEEDLILKGDLCSSTKEAKKMVAEQFRKQLSTLIAMSDSPAFSRRVESVGVEELTHHPLVAVAPDGGSKGSEMLQRMGWKQDEALGKDPQAERAALVQPVLSNSSRSGIGFGGVSSLSPQAIRQRLTEFAQSDKDELRFPGSLTTEERSVVHQVAEQFGLAHRSYGSGSDRQLVVSRKQSLPPPAEEPHTFPQCAPSYSQSGSEYPSQGGQQLHSNYGNHLSQGSYGNQQPHSEYGNHHSQGNYGNHYSQSGYGNHYSQGGYGNNYSQGSYGNQRPQGGYIHSQFFQQGAKRTLPPNRHHHYHPYQRS